MPDEPMPVKSCYRWENGMVMTFGLDGGQIPELQGMWSDDLVADIKARSTPETEFFGWPPGQPVRWGRLPPRVDPASEGDRCDGGRQ